MKTIEEYMRLPYRMEVIPDIVEGGYIIRFPELTGCLTCGDTIEEALKNAEECKQEWFIVALEEGIAIPEPIIESENVGEYSGQFKLRIPKSLHKSLAEHSKAEGISMNQYCLYLLTKNDSNYKRSNA